MSARGVTRGGFTLIELMMVVAILGLLAAMAIPGYRSAVNTARIAVAIREVTLLMNEIDLYEYREGTLPASLADIGRGGITDPWGKPYEYVNFALAVNGNGNGNGGAGGQGGNGNGGAGGQGGGGQGGGGQGGGGAGAGGIAGIARKDRFLVPINSKYDLYSKGPDGQSVGPLTAEPSRDDILRANDGDFVGIAENY